MAGEITRIRAVFYFEDSNGTEYDVQEVGIECDTETTLSFDVEHDGANGTVNPPIPRPKRPRI